MSRASALTGGLVRIGPEASTKEGAQKKQDCDEPDEHDIVLVDVALRFLEIEDIAPIELRGWLAQATAFADLNAASRERPNDHGAKRKDQALERKLKDDRNGNNDSQHRPKVGGSWDFHAH